MGSGTLGGPAHLAFEAVDPAESSFRPTLPSATVWQSIFSYKLCCYHTRKNPPPKGRGFFRACNRVKRRITWVLLYHMVMRFVHGPGFRLCVFGYNRFLGNWAKKQAPRNIARGQ